MADSAKDIIARLSDAPEAEVFELIVRYREDPRKQVIKALESAKKRIEKEHAEKSRVEEMYRLQRELSGGGLVVGVDEVGRGSVAGPLTVCAVCLPDEPIIYGLNDSKKLTATKREILAEQIQETAIAVGIAHIASQRIDEVGMAQSLRDAMLQAIKNTGIEPDCVLIDGNPMHIHPKEKTLVKGDARIAAIAAASIVAKVTRDALMVAYDEEYPGYHLAECKGYASSEHIEAIGEMGLSPIHRASFCGNFVKTQRLF